MIKNNICNYKVNRCTYIDQYDQLIFQIYNGKVNKEEERYIIKKLINGDSVTCKNAFVEPVTITLDGQIVAFSVLIMHNNYSKTFMVSYFEALEYHQGAIACLMHYAKGLSQEYGFKKILVGVNGHINCGIGILTQGFDKQTFASNYNPPYYASYFEGFSKKDHWLTCYNVEFSKFPYHRYSKLRNRSSKNYTLRSLDKNNFEEEIKKYVEFNNKAFLQHKFFYPRSFEEELEFYNSIYDRIEEENFIFAEKDGEIVGCIIWMPDYHEESKNTYKIIEMSVLPEYQKSFLLISLLMECYVRTIENFTKVESGWVFDDNINSKAVVLKLDPEEVKKLKVMEIDI